MAGKAIQERQGMDIRKLFGTILIGAGLANILNFWAPVPVPTVGITAFIIGGLCIGAGVMLRRSRPSARHIDSMHDRLGSLRGQDTDGKAPAKPVDALLAVRVLRLASESKGSLTVSRVAMDLNVPLDAAQTALEECVMKGTASMEIDGLTGITHYVFPEFTGGE